MLAVVILANATDVPTQRLAGQIAGIYLGVEPAPASPTPPAASAAPSAPGDVDLASFTGRYWSEELGTAYDVVQRGDALSLRHWRHGEIALRAAGGDEFGSSTWWVRRVEFTRDGDAISGLRISSPRVWNVSFERVDK